LLYSLIRKEGEQESKTIMDDKPMLDSPPGLAILRIFGETYDMTIASQ
jgi:hypothetical protein